jgi:hypothetical protein
LFRWACEVLCCRSWPRKKRASSSLSLDHRSPSLPHLVVDGIYAVELFERPPYSSKLRCTYLGLYRPAREGASWAPSASARRPASVILTRTSIVRPPPPATTRWLCAVASPAHTSGPKSHAPVTSPRCSRRDCPRAIRARGGAWREGCACARCSAGCPPRTLDVLTGRRCASRAAPVELPPVVQPTPVSGTNNPYGIRSWKCRTRPPQFLG